MVKEEVTDAGRGRALGEIKRIYLSKRDEIISRVNDFNKIWTRCNNEQSIHR